jgi:2-phosphoglycerate kinase
VAVGVLRERGDAEYAERYLLWRRYQEPDRPMILLLGGTSGVGKSALALEVARRLGIGRVQSTDSIREVMRILSSREQLPALFGSSYDAYRLLPRTGRAPTVLDGFLAQAELVSAGVRAAVDRSVAESTNLVIDGVSLVPGGLGLEVPDDRADVVFAVIAALDEDSLRDRFVVRAQGQRRRLASRYLENLDGILAIQRLLLELAAREGVPVVNNVLLEAAVQETIGVVMRALRRRSLPEAAAGREPT